MTDRELMQQALDALEGYARNCACEGGGAPCDAAKALRARLDGWERVNMNDHKEGDLGIGTVKWDASAPLVVHPHPAFQTTPPQQPEQEPVATLFGSLPVYDVPPKRRKPPTQDLSAPLTVNGVPMYPQREWQTLTDEEMFSLWVKCPAETEDRFAFARAIEAKLKEKNGY